MSELKQGLCWELKLRWRKLELVIRCVNSPENADNFTVLAARNAVIFTGDVRERKAGEYWHLVLVLRAKTHLRVSTYTHHRSYLLHTPKFQAEVSNKLVHTSRISAFLEIDISTFASSSIYIIRNRIPSLHLSQ